MATGKGKLLFDYICSNIPNKLANTNLAHTPYIFVKKYKKRYELRYKYIRGERKTNLTYKTSVLPISKVFGFDGPDKQRSTLNKLVNRLYRQTSSDTSCEVHSSHYSLDKRLRLS